MFSLYFWFRVIVFLVVYHHHHHTVTTLTILTVYNMCVSNWPAQCIFEQPSMCWNVVQHQSVKQTHRKRVNLLAGSLARVVKLIVGVLLLTSTNQLQLLMHFFMWMLCTFSGSCWRHNILHAWWPVSWSSQLATSTSSLFILTIIYWLSFSNSNDNNNTSNNSSGNN